MQQPFLQTKRAKATARNSFFFPLTWSGMSIFSALFLMSILIGCFMDHNVSILGNWYHLWAVACVTEDHNPPSRPGQSQDIRWRNLWNYYLSLMLQSWLLLPWQWLELTFIPLGGLNVLPLTLIYSTGGLDVLPLTLIYSTGGLNVLPLTLIPLGDSTSSPLFSLA